MVLLLNLVVAWQYHYSEAAGKWLFDVPLLLSFLSFKNKQFEVNILMHLTARITIIVSCFGNMHQML